MRRNTLRKTVTSILAEVASENGLTVSELVGESRQRRYAWPRQEAYFRVFTQCPHIGYPDMGRRIGWRDHTTCIHGVRAHCKRIGLTYDAAKVMRECAAKAAGAYVPERYQPLEVLMVGYSMAMDQARAGV